MEMLVILWIVFAFLSAVAESTYRFRFHTCIQEDQKILETENLISLNQVAFIDDGSLSYHNEAELDKTGFKIDGGAVLGDSNHNLTGYKTGGESAHRVISIAGSDRFIVINFWTHTYYMMAKGDEYSLSKPSSITPIQPDISHFIRVYFVCAPGNSRSALVLFGPQATLRKKGEEGKETTDRTKRDTAGNSNSKPGRAEWDRKRLAIIASLRVKMHLMFAFIGFTSAVILNALVLAVFLFLFREGTAPQKEVETPKTQKSVHSKKLNA